MIYFDNAATTPCSDEVVKSMVPYFTEKFGNPSSIYALGREAKAALWDARFAVATLLNAKASEIIFTSGATESNNLAIKGASQAGAMAVGNIPHIITSSIEHHCVLDSVKNLEMNYGVEVTYLPVDKYGLVNPEEVKKSIKDNTVLVTVMMGNNEVGTLEPIAKIGKVIAEAREDRKKREIKIPIVFHTDAVQAFQYFDLNVDKLGVDMLSLTAHKFYGPKGVGLLYVRGGTKFIPQQQGGAQERGLRAGTENVPYIIGMVEAMKEARAKQPEKEKQVAQITDYLIERVTKEIPEVEVLGPLDKSKRLPHIAAFLFKKIEGESILINLDMLGFAASSGSACTSGSLEPSHVTKAMGYSDLDAHGAVRFSLGIHNTKEEVDELMKHLPKIVEKLRAMSPIK